jgi:cytochrome c-type biogenesis protein CcmH/NrfG
MRKGDYPAAATALDGLLIDHPGDPRAQLYLGIARLFQDEPQNALELLRPLEFNAPPAIAAEAAWYSLVGIARLRDPSGVEAEAKTLCSSALPTGPRACAALETLSKSRSGW